MAWIRSEEEALSIVEQMKNKNSGKYITQGVSLSKDNERHMELLKLCLMYSSSFSGLVKELIANRFSETSSVTNNVPIIQNNNTVATFNHNEGNLNNFKEEDTQKVNTGNFF